jgi:hypothetical protein
LALIDQDFIGYYNRPSLKPASQTASHEREDNRTVDDFDLAYHNLLSTSVAQYTIQNAFFFGPNSSSTTHKPWTVRRFRKL